MDDNDHDNDNDHLENLKISLHLLCGSSLVWNE